MPSPLLRLGTRGSPLALAQANETAQRLTDAHGLEPGRVEIVPIRTTGDRIRDRPLSEAGGKSLFTKEIEDALAAGDIDIAVHSAKDLPTLLPPGLALAAFLPREDVRDAFLSPKAATLDGLPRGAVLGTSSLRRRALSLRLRPDLSVVEFRGNVETRLQKLADGVADATLLAAAGLKRLGLIDRATSFTDPLLFLPAVGQGAIVVEARADDRRTNALLAAINHGETEICLRAERAFLAALDGSCRTPIGGLARLDAGRIAFRGIIVRPDGSEAHEVARAGTPRDAVLIGRDAGEELVRRGGPDFFDLA